MSCQKRFALGAMAACALLLSAAPSASAQQFEHINSFAGCPVEGCAPDSDASVPTALVRGPDGNFYGIGDSGLTIFRQLPDGPREVLHRFDGIGPTGCGTLRISFGDDGAIYGVGLSCGGVEGRAIFRLNGTSFEILQEFPAGAFTPIWMIAGSNGAYYGGGVDVFATRYQLFKWDGNITLFNQFVSLVSNLQLAPDGNLYFVKAYALPLQELYGGYVVRLTPDDQFQIAYEFPGVTYGPSPNADLIVGDDGFLYGTTTRLAGPAPSERRIYRLGLSGGFTYLPGSNDLDPVAVAVDGSVFVIISGHGATLSRLMRDGTLVPIHTFTDFSTTMPPTRGTDGHLYGVRPEGGEHGRGVFFRIRMPSVDVKANGADGPATVNAGDPLQISMAFDASATEVVEPAEVYLAVITPSLEVYWATATGFSETPSPLYSGPLHSFGAAPLINISEAAVLPPGDYYWVTIVDADADGVPNGHYVDFVKTTKAAAAVTTQRRR